MAEDKNTVGLTIKIGELESFIKDTLGSSKGTAWENVSIINKSGASHEIVASSFIKRAISSSKKTGVPLSEVFTKLEPYPDAIHTFSGKQIVSTVKGHPGSVTMHKTLSLTAGATPFPPHPDWRQYKITGLKLLPHNVGGSSSAPNVAQIAAASSDTSPKGDAWLDEVFFGKKGSAKRKRSAFPSLDNISVGDWRYKEFPEAAKAATVTQVFKDTAKIPEYFPKSKYSYFDYHERIYPSKSDIKNRGQAFQGFYNNNRVIPGTYHDLFQVRATKTGKLVGSVGVGDFSRIDNFYNGFDDATNKKHPKGDARAFYDKFDAARQHKLLYATSPFADAGQFVASKVAGVGNSVFSALKALLTQSVPSNSALGVMSSLAKPATGSVTSNSSSTSSSGLLSDASTLGASHPSSRSVSSSTEASQSVTTNKSNDGGGKTVSPQSPSGGDPTKGASNKRRGGFVRQGAEQMRHAFWWSLYSAPLAGAVTVGAKFFGGDRFAESAAHNLIGVGMHSQEDRDRVLRYGRMQSEKTPYTRPQDFINAYRETVSGLGVDPTPENIPELLSTSKSMHSYSQYAMQSVSAAARSLSRQTMQVKAVAPEFKNASNTKIADHIANALAGIYKTSSVKGEEMDTFMRYGGSALMGQSGWGWDYATTAAFGAQLIQSGMGGSQAGVSAKHMATGVPFYQQAAKIELIRRKMRENAANPRIGWTRDAIPFDMFKRGYWQKHKAELAYEASNQAKIFRAGPEQALAKLQEHGATVSRLTNMGLPMSGLAIEQMMPLFGLVGQQSKQDVVGNVSEMVAAATKAAQDQELLKAEKAKEYDNSLSASWSRISNSLFNTSAEKGQSWFGRTFHYLANHLENNSSAIDAVSSGNKQEAAARYLKLAASTQGAAAPGAVALRSDMVYTEIMNQLRLKGATKDNKISSSSLPAQLQGYVSREFLVGNKYYPRLRELISDIPQISKDEFIKEDRVTGTKFKLPLEGVGGLPGQQDLIKEMQLIPERIAQKLSDNTPDVTVNVNGVDATVAVEHTNKPVTGVPAAPANAAPAGYFKWGYPGKAQYDPYSNKGMKQIPMPGNTVESTTKFWGSQTK